MDTGVTDQELPNLGSLLSQVSTARGRGVSGRRFELLLGKSNELINGGVADRIEWAWAQQFPSGSLIRKALKDLKTRDMPVIIVEPDDCVYLVRGVGSGLSRDGLDENDRGEMALVLQTGEEAESRASIPRVDSGDWFRAAFRAHGQLYRDVVLASLIVSVLGIVSAIYTMQVYDRVVPTGSLATLFVLTVGVCVSIALEALGRQLKTFLVHRSADQIDQKLGQIFSRRHSRYGWSRDRGRWYLASQIRGHELYGSI